MYIFVCVFTRHTSVNTNMDHDSGCIKDMGEEMCFLDKLEKLPVEFTEELDSEGHVCAEDECQRVVINVSGLKFETQIRTLNRFPETLLGDITKRRKYWDNRRKEFFFDRHRLTFQSILYFYQSGGRLKRPPEVPSDVFLQEIKFYEFDIKVIEAYKEKEGFPPEHKERQMPTCRLQKQIWQLLEYPDSSFMAKIVVILSVIFVIVSIVTFCVETLPEFENCVCMNQSRILNNETIFVNIPNFKHPLFCIEAVCMTFFILELTIRFITCPSKFKFVKNTLNWIDLAAILPFVIFIVLFLITGDCGTAQNTGAISVIRILRVTRILKLSKHSIGLQLLGKTLSTSWRELFMLTIFLGICIVVFSGAIYYAEFEGEDSHFDSIPSAFWWAVVTITTVGYGDMYPLTAGGRLVGTLAVLCGILALSFPVPVIVTNFSKYYKKYSKRTFRDDYY